MQQREIRRGTVLTVSDKGGTLDMVHSESGEVVMSFVLPSGQNSANEFVSLIEDGYHLEAGLGCVAWSKPARVRVMDFGEEAFASAACPDYVVSPAQRQARALELHMQKMVNGAVERRMAVLDARAERSFVPVASEEALEVFEAADFEAELTPVNEAKASVFDEDVSG